MAIAFTRLYGLLASVTRRAVEVEDEGALGASVLVLHASVRAHVGLCAGRGVHLLPTLLGLNRTQFCAFFWRTLHSSYSRVASGDSS
jgi:hypothetical protein